MYHVPLDLISDGTPKGLSVPKGRGKEVVCCRCFSFSKFWESDINSVFFHFCETLQPRLTY